MNTLRTWTCGPRWMMKTLAYVGALVLVVLFVSLLGQDKTASSVSTVASDKTSEPAFLLAGPVQATVAPLARSEALRQHVRNFCRKLNFKTVNKHSADTLHHLLYDDKHEVIYCYVPKVACTGWRRVFLRMGGKVSPEEDITLTRGEVHTINIPHLASSRNQEEKLKTYRKFMFVRQPFERALSAYRDKLEGVNELYDFHKKVGMKIEKKYRGSTAAGGHNVTFREFIRYISEPGRGTPEQRNEHWLPMHELCDPCSVQYDFIGTMENLHEDADYVLQWLGVKGLVGQFPASDRPVNASRHVNKYLKQLNNAEILAFHAKFLPDYLLFHYEFL